MNTNPQGSQINPHIVSGFVIVVLLVGVGWLATKYDLQLRSQIFSSSTAPIEAGWDLMPRLDEIMASENVPLTAENWHYYAWLVTRPATHPEAIQDEEELRSAMRYWLGRNPAEPRGSIEN